MGWNYRVLKTLSKGIKDKRGKWVGRGEPSFTIREVFYRKNGKPWGMSQEDDAPVGGSVEDLRTALVMMLRDTYKAPVVDERNWKRSRPIGKARPGSFERAVAMRAAIDKLMEIEQI